MQLNFNNKNRHGRPARTPHQVRGKGVSATHQHHILQSVLMGGRDRLRFAPPCPAMTVILFDAGALNRRAL